MSKKDLALNNLQGLNMLYNPSNHQPSVNDFIKMFEKIF